MKFIIIRISLLFCLINVILLNMVSIGNAQKVTYNIVEDPSLKVYLIQARIGSRNEIVQMLIDSIANGTALHYAATSSSTSVVKGTSETVVTPIAEYTFKGKNALDNMCFESDLDKPV